MKKNKKILTLVLLAVLGGLFINTQPAQALLDIPYNIADMQLNSLDFIEDAVLKTLVLLVLLVVESTTFVVISAGLLDWASSLPSGLYQPPGLDPTLVTTGWNFTSGLANMFFILIFIVIAFSYFFKEDTWHMQKALPRLIAIALLVNFSLLLVGMLVDVGWIIQNSFRNVFFEEKELASAAMQPLIGSSKGVLLTAAAIPLGYLTTALIPTPFLSVWALGGVGFIVLAGEAIFGMISQTILLIIFNFASGLVFLAYAILFLVRIGFIWLLAITAPLAFMAFILPQTEKYFKQWLEALFKWTFLGVIVFFLMGLGLKLFGTFATGSDFPMAEGFGGWNFSKIYYKYIFLLVYLIIALTTVKKFMPAGMEAVWSLTERTSKALNVGLRKATLPATKFTFAATRGAIKGAQVGRGAYDMVRGRGWTRRQAFGAALERGWREVGSEVEKALPRPPEGYLKAASEGLKKAAWEILTAAMKTKKKKKLTKEQIARGEVEEQSTEDLVEELLERIKKT